MKKVILAMSILFASVLSFANDNGKILEFDKTADESITVYKHEEAITYRAICKEHKKEWKIYKTPEKKDLIYTAEVDDVFYIQKIRIHKKNNSETVSYEVKVNDKVGWLCDYTYNPYDGRWGKVTEIVTSKETMHCVDFNDSFLISAKSKLYELPDFNSKIVAVVNYTGSEKFAEKIFKTDLLTAEKNTDNYPWVRIEYKGKKLWISGYNCSKNRGGPLFPAPFCATGDMDVSWELEI